MPCFAPGFDASRERADIEEPHGTKRARGQCRSFSGFAVQHDVGVVIQRDRLDQFFKSTSRCHQRAFDHPTGDLIEVPDIEQLKITAELLFELVRLDLDDLGTSASTQLRVGR